MMLTVEYEDNEATALVNILGILYCVKLSLNDRITVGWVVSEALRQAPKLSKMTIKGITSRRMGSVSVLEMITSAFLDSVGELVLLLEGCFVDLPNNIMHNIFAYCINSVHDIVTLQRVNKKLYSVCSCDTTWESLSLRPLSDWSGVGACGEEAVEWSAYQQCFGLPHRNCFRVRWISHYQSRLKLAYGTLRKQLTTEPTDTRPMNNVWNNLASSLVSSLNCIGDNQYCNGNDFTSLSYNPILDNHIVTIIGDCGNQTASSFHTQLNYILPDSSRVSGLAAITPLLKETYIDRIELMPGTPITCMSNSVNASASTISKSTGGCSQLFPRLGTVVECSIQKMVRPFVLRRLGDSRLSFAQFDIDITLLDNDRANNGNPAITRRAVLDFIEHSDLFGRIIDKSVAMVFVVKFTDDIQRLWRTLRVLLQSFWSQSSALSKVCRSNRVSRTLVMTNSKPLLVMLSVPFPSADATKGATSTAACVREKVMQVAGMLKSLISQGNHQDHSSLWYVQPFREIEPATTQHDVNPLGNRAFRASIYDMRFGYFAGINWLLRAIAAERSKRL